MQAQDGLVRLAWLAMNTQFEVALWGGRESLLAAAAEEVMREIKLWEEQLSFYRATSDVSDINARAAWEAVPVEPRVFRLLQRAKELSETTGGAFDITIAPLLRAWGFSGAGGRVPSEEEIDGARAVTGMHLVELDSENSTVRFVREGMQIDLGAIGKGFAIEQATGLLRDFEILGALIHGGTSTVQAIGTQPDGSSWNVAVQHPIDPGQALTIVALQDAALSVSAPHGKSFIEGGTVYGHVLDPRIGRPIQGALLAAVISPSATDSDALSTALLALGEPGLAALDSGPGVSGALVAYREPNAGLRVEASGSLATS